MFYKNEIELFNHLIINGFSVSEVSNNLEHNLKLRFSYCTEKKICQFDISRSFGSSFCICEYFRGNFTIGQNDFFGNWLYNILKSFYFILFIKIIIIK